MNTYFTGDDWPTSGSISNADGSALNLTGATIEVAVLNEYGVQVGATQNGTIDNVTTGAWSCIIPRAITATVPVGYANIRMQVTQNSLKQEYRLETVQVGKGALA
jgi:hypothetical protein